MKEALELYLEDKHIQKPSRAEAPIVITAKVKVSDFLEGKG